MAKNNPTMETLNSYKYKKSIKTEWNFYQDTPESLIIEAAISPVKAPAPVLEQFWRVV